MEHCSDNVWPSTESSSIVDMTTNDLDTLLNADMFSLDLQWYSWDESLPDSIQSQYEVGDFPSQLNSTKKPKVPSIPPLDATRQYSTTSSSSSQPSYEYHCENQILDDSLRFQGINGVNQSSGMSILQPDTGTISSGSIPYQSSPSPVSPDSMSPTGRIYTGEYMTAKQKSLLVSIIS